MGDYTHVKVLYLVIFIVLALALQIFLFFFARKKKKEVRSSPAIFDKYDIKSRGDLFKMINSHHIPEEDRLRLEELYQKGTL